MKEYAISRETLKEKIIRNYIDANRFNARGMKEERNQTIAQADAVNAFLFSVFGILINATTYDFHAVTEARQSPINSIVILWNTQEREEIEIPY